MDNQWTKKNLKIILSPHAKEKILNCLQQFLAECNTGISYRTHTLREETFTCGYFYIETKEKNMVSY